MNTDTESRTVLFIDDDTVAHTIVETMLAAEGYRVLSAFNGAAGIRLVENEHVDIVITDIVMPGMDGIEVLERTRALYPDKPVIVMSGWGQLEDVKTALRLGAYDYLSKDENGINRETLCAAVGRAWERLQLKRDKELYQQHLEQRIHETTEQLQQSNEEWRAQQQKLNDRLIAQFEDVELSERKYRTLMQKAPGGIATFDLGMRITDANQVFLKTLHFDEAAPLDENAVHNNQYFAQSTFPKKIWQCIESKAELAGTQDYYIGNSEKRVLEYTLTPIPLDDRGFRAEVLFTVRDVTLEMEEKARLEERANYDEMTGLLKGEKLDETLAQALPALGSDDTLALLHLDLDDFRDINTEFGHQVGSKVLSIVGQRIQGCISRDKDYAFRTGGDEFAVLLTRYAPGTLELVVQRVTQRLANVFSVSVAGQAVNLNCTFSVGVAEYSQTREQDAELLYKEADDATYQAKEQGKNCVVYFDPQ